MKLTNLIYNLIFAVIFWMLIVPQVTAKIILPMVSRYSLLKNYWENFIVKYKIPYIIGVAWAVSALFFYFLLK